MNHFRKLLLLLLATVWLAPVAMAQQRADDAVLSVADEPSAPQWTDIGMHDVLAAGSTTTLTPPTTVRLVHDTPSTAAPHPADRQAAFAATRTAVTSAHLFARKGYIYLLRCLRL